MLCSSNLVESDSSFRICCTKMAFNSKQSVVSIEFRCVFMFLAVFLLININGHNGYARAEHHCNHKHPKANEV